jgi:RNA polymerase Rpb4
VAKYPNRNLTRTLDYLETFSRFKDEENIKAVERLLNSHTELEMFERSQLGMICGHSWFTSPLDKFGS